MKASFPLSRFLLAVLALALGGLCFFQALAAKRQANMIELLRFETRLLELETRLLRQQLEAERILASAQARASATSKQPPSAP